MLLVVSVFVVADVLLAIIPIFIGRFVAALASTPIPTGEVYWYAAALIGCSVGHDLTWRASELLYRQLLNHRGYEYDNIVFQTVITQEYPYFVDKSTGKISSYVGTLGREFRNFLDAACFTYVDQLVKIPAIIVIMFTVNTPSGLFFTAAILLLVLVGRRTIRRASRAEMGLTAAGAEMDGYVIDVIANFVSVKSFGREESEQAQVRARRRVVIDAANRSSLWTIVFWASMSLVVRYVVWPGTLLLNLHLFLRGELTIGELTTLLSTLVIFSELIWGSIWEISQLSLQLARVEEAYRYLFAGRDIVRPTTAGPERPATARARAVRPDPAAEPATVAPIDVVAALATARQLELCDLTFSYPDSPADPVLRGLNLTIVRNEKIGVVGRSGSGKTTLLKLLLGYYPLPLGMLTLDGRAIPNRQLARAISYVPQDISLFHRSIRENITYGAAVGVGEAEVELAARRAHAHEFIARTAAGYDTLVGERGIRLSTGQRQRIAIARAFLDHKPLLVLDEATSALDTESELLVQHALEDLWRDRTVIAVAHRLSTLLRMDRIVVLDGGRIVEQGSHAELLDAGGQYHHLWQRQNGEMIGAD